MPAGVNRRSAALLISAVAVLASCEVSKRSEVCVPANNGKTMSVIGYVAVGGFSLVSSDNEFPLKLVESMSAETEIRVYVKLGEGPNTMKPLPDGDFTNDDVEIQLADGNKKGWGDRIKVTGTLAVEGDACRIRELSKIEAP